MAPPTHQKPRNIALPPSVWGPIFWHTIHIVALGYPIAPTETDKAAARQFYESLATLIPCPICREHYKMNLEVLPIQNSLNTRSELVEWTWEMHNLVNDQLGKPQVSMDEFLDHISSLSPSQAATNGIHTSQGTTTNGHISAALIAGLVVGGVAGYIAFKRCK